MYGLSQELKEKIGEFNTRLNEKYKKLFEMDGKDIRRFIEDNIGQIVQLEKLSHGELNNFYSNGGVVGVDGSKNRIGGAYPHYVEIYQGLAKSSISNKVPIFKADYFTPLDDEFELEIDEDARGKEGLITDYKLSGIEVDVALESIKEHNPSVIMMDGSLIRYDIECFDKWINLRRECEERGIILIGVIKDIKTNIVENQLCELGLLEGMANIYDREVMYGLLDYGEAVKISDEVTKKSKEGFTSLFMRSSYAPNVIGMDMLDSQRKYLEEMARLVFTLTPQNSRGVPLWLDIVDSEVKLTDKMIRSLLENYLDRDILEKFFISERDKRTL